MRLRKQKRCTSSFCLPSPNSAKRKSPSRGWKNTTSIMDLGRKVARIGSTNSIEAGSGGHAYGPPEYRQCYRDEGLIDRTALRQAELAGSCHPSL
jgi:hypothetical protein